MDPVNIATIVVALIAAASALASQRAAARASVVNTNTSSRTELETEAYTRARAIDVETIERQDQELQDLRVDNQRLTAEVLMLRSRISRLEAILPQNIEEVLRGRLEG